MNRRADRVAAMLRDEFIVGDRLVWENTRWIGTVESVSDDRILVHWTNDEPPYTLSTAPGAEVNECRACYSPDELRLRAKRLPTAGKRLAKLERAIKVRGRRQRT